MRSVGIKALKNRLSEYVRLASGGETVLVTKRDKVVAELVPPRAGPAIDVSDSQFAEAVRQGWLTPPIRPPGDAPPQRPVVKFAKLMEDLARDREDR